MVRARLHNIQHLVNILVSIFSHNSEGSKQLSSQKLSLLFTSEVSQWHEDSSWLPRSINFWNFVVLERFAAPKDFGAVELKNSINVRLDLRIVPGKDWADSEILKVTLLSLRLPGL